MQSVYTRKGDDGKTGLLGRPRASKASPIFDAIGAVDALNAHIGVAIYEATKDPEQRVLGDEDIEFLCQIQSELMQCGEALATGPKFDCKAFALLTGRIETAIDAVSESLPPLRNFLLVRGQGSYLNVARTACRTAEREIVRSQGDPEIIKYMNRLSDYLFELMRKANERDILWIKKSK